MLMGDLELGFHISLPLWISLPWSIWLIIAVDPCQRDVSKIECVCSTPNQKPIKMVKTRPFLRAQPWELPLLQGWDHHLAAITCLPLECGWWQWRKLMSSLLSCKFVFKKHGLIQWLKSLRMCGTTWICKSTFSTLNVMKPKYRWSISDESLSSQLKLCSWCKLNTRFPKLNIQKCHLLHWWYSNMIFCTYWVKGNIFENLYY